MLFNINRSEIKLIRKLISPSFKYLPVKIAKKTRLRVSKIAPKQESNITINKSHYNSPVF